MTRQKQTCTGPVLGDPLFLADSPLIDVHRDPGIRVTERFPRGLDVDPGLTESCYGAFDERVETTRFCHADLLQRRPDLALQNGFRRDRLFPILLDRGKDKVCVGAIERLFPPLLQFLNDK